MLLSMKINFDIDDFIAYLLSGALMLISLVQMCPSIIEIVVKNYTFSLKNQLAVEVLSILSLMSVVLLLGHVSSIFSRSHVRPLLRKFLFNPRMDALFDELYVDEFWSNEFKRKIFTNFNNKFGVDINECKDAAPRIIRSYVVNNNAETKEVREKIVRTRSLCSNCTLPIFVLTLTSFIQAILKADPSLLPLSLTFLLIFLYIIIKQIDLDLREWKEVYTAFFTN